MTTPHTDITEMVDFDAQRVDGVQAAASGFPFLVMKALEDEPVAAGRAILAALAEPAAHETDPPRPAVNAPGLPLFEGESPIDRAMREAATTTADAQASSAAAGFDPDPVDQIPRGSPLAAALGSPPSPQDAALAAMKRSVVAAATARAVVAAQSAAADVQRPSNVSKAETPKPAVDSADAAAAAVKRDALVLAAVYGQRRPGVPNPNPTAKTAPRR
jgi:hypothetical protein